MDSTEKPYPDVSPQPKFPELEEKILAYWREEKIFEESIASRPAHRGAQTNEFVFYDGPPFANGLPHYGHLLTGYVKDLIPRYQTMKGRRVDRRFGWDCHGLPAEMESEKELKVSGRIEIQKLGIDVFNEHCRQSVLRYTKEWESYVTRQARWVSFQNDYKTMDLSYMESVIWAFKELWKKGLIYEGYRVMPYSWACETPLSNFEIRMDNAYRSRQDPAITVALSLTPIASDGGSIKALIWTTTPWTLPSNLAIAVGPDVTYVVIESKGERYLLAEAALPRYVREFPEPAIVRHVKGSELVERTYSPLFSYFSDHPNSFRILADSFVTTEDGTGIVHMAPGFGEDDQRVCESHGIELVCPVDHQGKFTPEVRDFEGRQVQEANKDIIRALKDRGVLLRHDTIEHNYPHCWRTDTPIIYKAVSSWYVEVTKFKDRMVELNQRIQWIPDHIRDGQFGRWLENARDWSISRNRFWGTPIPVWRSDNPEYPRIDVYGSLAEIERDFGVAVTDLHRPYIDQLTRPNPDDPTGKSTMRRVEEVFDCWFESGSMPFAQIHYPFENKEWFEAHFPADFIVEYVAQTRGWFYTLMVLATSLFDCPPFRNCMCHGVVLDAEGQKLSKRLRNYPDPVEVFRTIGADALRWFLVSSPILRGNDLHIDKEGRSIAEVVRAVLNPLWNAYYFFTLYANTDAIRADWSTTSTQVLDVYILAKTGALIRSVTTHMDRYELAEACQSLLRFSDAFNNWYIRRSRDRFWKSERDEDKMEAYRTLYTVLHTVTRLNAPFLPLLTEEMYRGLTRERSVHLCDWPDAECFPANDALVAQMDLVREVCSAGLSLRESHKLRTRLPLRTVTICGEGVEDIGRFEALIRDELNVKEVVFSREFDRFASHQLTINAKALGPRVGGKVQEIIRHAKSGSWTRGSDGRPVVDGLPLHQGEYSLKLIPREGVAAQELAERNVVVALDIDVTAELEDEGLARDLIRAVQQARKDAGFHVADRIQLSVEADPDVVRVVDVHRGYITEQTLATSLVTDGAQGAFVVEGTVASGILKIGLSKA